MAGNRSPSPSESESREQALRSLRYNRFSNEMSNNLFDSRAFSDDGENQEEFYFDDEVYGDEGYEYQEERGYYDEDHRSSSRRSRHRSREHRRHRSRSRSKSRSKSSTKATSKVDPPQVDPKMAVRVSKEKAKRLRKWILQGLTPSESKSLREAYSVEFESSFKLICPKIDESMARKLLEYRNGGNPNARKRVDFVEKGWASNQYQIIDAMRPLVKLWNSKLPDDPDVKDLETSLQLLCGAFFNTSKMRRSNVLRQIAPRMMSLLDDPSVFSSHECERLFGNKFLDALLKETEESDKLARLGRIGGPHNRSFGSQSYSRGGGGSRFSPYPNQGNRGRGGGPQQRGGGGGGYQGQRGGQNQGQQQYRYVSSSLPFPTQPAPTSGDLEVGARLSHFVSAWSSFTSDPWVLSVIYEGYYIDFVEHPVQFSFPPDCVMSNEMSAVCDQEIQALLAKKAIFPISRPVDGFVSNMFAVKKKKEKEEDPQLWRPIINLKSLNSFVVYEHFKMEGLDSVKFIIRENDWMVKVDLKDAYFTVPVANEHQKFLRFIWKGRFYQYVCLPFGLCSAPRVFTKILKPVVAWLRARGIRLVIYLDDFLIMAESVSLLMSHLNCILYILRSLGFLFNEKKSILAPSQEIEFLGLVIDSVSLSFSLPTVKVDKVIQLCEKALRAERISLRDLASLLGNFSWAIPTVPFAQAHYRILQRFFIFESRKFNNNLNKVVSLPPFAKKDIEWWISNLRSFNGKKMIPVEPDVVIFSDASLTGWGACCEEITTRGPWTLADKSRHINELELLGAFYALQVFTQHSSDISVQLYLDNSTAVSYINKCGGTRSKALCDLASCVINWCEFRNIQLSAFHLPGSLNVVADCESRSAMDASDWMLDKRLFQKIRSLWRVEIDLFASAWNAQLPAFVSWIRQPLALTTNAFSLSWKNRLNYAFPPFSLIPRCLAKIRKEKASVVLVCPLWPSQAWFPLLLELASDIPRLLSPHPSLLTSSLQEPHPLNDSLILTVWKLSGNVSETNDFRRMLSNSYLAPTVHPRNLLTSPPGTVGLIGVLNETSIPCLMI